MTVRAISQELQFAISFLFEIAIIFRMRQARLDTQARWFFVYMIFQLLVTPIEYLAYHWGSDWVKFYVVWSANAITVILGFSIIAELFARMFAPYAGIRRLARLLFVASCTLLVVIAAVSAIYQKSGTGYPMFDFVLTMERSVRIVQLGLIVFLFLLSSSLGLHWRNCLFGIALGFGFYALVDLTTLALWMRNGASAGPLYTVATGLAYTLSVLIWSAYILQREAAKVPVADWPSKDLERWDKSLTDLLVR